MLLVQYKHRTKLSYRNLTLSGTGNHFSRGTDYMQAEQGGGLPDGLLYLQVSCIGHLSPPKCSPGKCSIPAAEIVSLILSLSAIDGVEAFFDMGFTNSDYM